MKRQFLAGASLFAAVAVMGIHQPAQAEIFDNDTFLLMQNTSDTFDLFINDAPTRTLMGTGDLRASFGQQELAGLLLTNNNLDDMQASMAMFTEFVDRELSGLMSARITQDTVTITFNRQLATENRSGQSSFKYSGPRGRDRNFVTVTGMGASDVPENDSQFLNALDELPPTDGPDSRGGKGPFNNDTLTLTQRGGNFLLDINGVQFDPIEDTGGEIIEFQVATDDFKAIVLSNNGVSGRFLGEDTFFFEFLAKGNSGLIDVALRDDTISFDIAREFVLDELEGESSFKYNALGQRARNFVNFKGVVEAASPST